MAAAAELSGGRRIGVPRPRPGAGPLREAYLELLKLCLCDLAGARTLSVSKAGGRGSRGDRLFARELHERELEIRTTGLDWPFSGMTMIGLARLDDLQACVEAVVADGVEGDVIEAGVWRGGASILARATLDSLGADERTVWLADSFQGLPAPDEEAFPEDRELDLSRVDFLAVPADEVRANLARFGCEQGVEFVEGLFDQTLPGLRGHQWSVIRLDGDTYEATWVGLESLYPGLSAGGYVIIDDYGLIEECRRAVDDYRRAHGITETIEKVDATGIHWRRREAGPSITSVESPPRRGARSSTRREVTHRKRHRIATHAEYNLEFELGRVREQLVAAEAELDRLRPSPPGTSTRRARAGNEESR
jgi:O-methyltransferase